MIPYEQLVAALASWRQRQGLPAGPADYLGEPAEAGAYDYASAPPADSAYGGDAYGGGAYGSEAYGASAYGEDVVELSDDMMDSVVEEPSSPWSVEASEMVDDGSGMSQDTEDEGTYAEPEPPAPAPEPEPPASGKRKRKK